MGSDLRIADDDIFAGVHHDPVVIVRIRTQFAPGGIVRVDLNVLDPNIRAADQVETPCRRVQQPDVRDGNAPAVADTDHAAPGDLGLHLKRGKHQAAGIDAAAARDPDVGIRPLGGIEKAGIAGLFHALKGVSDHGVKRQVPTPDQRRVRGDPQLDPAPEKQGTGLEPTSCHKDRVAGCAGINGCLNRAGAVRHPVPCRAERSDIRHVHRTTHFPTEVFTAPPSHSA